MAASEVFRPSNGDLLVRAPMQGGAGGDYMRRSLPSSARPQTQGGYRFGQLSHHSFFARHNPHPGRVRHIKGLLDVPICAVNDDGYFSNPRYSLNFPPNGTSEEKLRYSKYSAGSTMPAAAINVNSTRHPVNTLSGLQHFLGKPMNMRVFREKAVPKAGGPGSDAWRDELRALTDALGVVEKPRKMEPARPRTTQYSAATGRLIPPPSRAMSRGRSAYTSNGGAIRGTLAQLTEDPEMEDLVMQMLCQILQTDDFSAVQSWLTSAGDREKTMVLDMLKSAMSNTGAYYERDPVAEYVIEEANRPKTAVSAGYPEFAPAPDVNNLANQYDRLTLEEVSPRPGSVVDVGYARPSYSAESPRQFGMAGLQQIKEDDIPDGRAQMISDMFDRKSVVDKPETPTLRLTTGKPPLLEKPEDFTENPPNVWEPGKSTV